jgi:Rrf2 family protein
MTLLNRKVDYALLILSYLHHHADGGSAREIAARFELSRAFVANILKLLCHKGFVTSHRGVKGGYVLERPADEVNLAELMEALDDSFHLAECNKEGPLSLCSLMHLCPVRGAIGEVHRRIREILRTVTLAEVFGPADGFTQVGLNLSSLDKQLVATGDTN